MTVLEQTQALLVAAAAVTALVPASRIRAPGDWQGLADPYIIHFPVSGRSELTFEATAALNHWDYYQVSVFASAYSSALAITAAVRTAVNGKHGKFRFHSGPPLYVGRDDNVNLEHLILNFQVSGQET